MPVHNEHVELLNKKGVKFSQDKLIFTLAAPPDIKTDAGVVFMEEGNAKSGLLHFQKHNTQFADKGLSGDQLVLFIENKLSRSPDSVGKPSGAGQTGTLAMYSAAAGKGLFDVCIVIGSNGYIVTAHPDAVGPRGYYRILREAATAALEKEDYAGLRNAVGLIGLAGYEGGAF